VLYLIISTCCSLLMPLKRPQNMSYNRKIRRGVRNATLMIE